MPWASRIEFSGAFYHVMNRGNHKEPIFCDDTDRCLLLDTLAETCRSAGWAVHSFVFMPNHDHLLIETRRPTLVKGMQWLNSTSTRPPLRTLCSRLACLEKLDCPLHGVHPKPCSNNPLQTALAEQPSRLTD
ncbi:MAG: transposase [Verrucomicrobiae bacterium]|nr:transposase [Verrucomicrobiae bacterium]